MEGLFIIQLVGVAGLFIGLGFFVSIVLKMRRTLTEMDSTLRAIGNEVMELTPRISSTLQEIEKTGEDIGRTANASTALINRLNGKTGTSPLLDGVVHLLPAAAALLKLAAPVFRRKKEK